MDLDMKTLTIIVVCMLPLAGVGLYYFFRGINEKIMVKRGYYKVKLRLENFRVKIKYMKPENGCFTTKDLKTYSFSNTPGKVFFEGNTPVVEYDARKQQIDFNNAYKDRFDSASKDVILQRVYNLGQRMGAVGQKKMMNLLFGSLICSGLTLLILILLLSGNLEVGSLAAQ